MQGTGNQSKLSLIDTAIAVGEDKSRVEPCFMAKFLIQCTIPHSDPGPVPVWTRKNGTRTLMLQPGWDVENNRPLGLPYGMMPRLILIWIVTEAKRKSVRKLHMGHSLSGFMRTLGLDPSRGGKRSDTFRLKDAAVRLFSTRFSHYEDRIGATGTIHGRRYSDMQVAPERELYWESDRQTEAVMWGSWIELGEKFFNAIIESTVPCDMVVLRQLTRSPLAVDLYMLCNWVGANLEKPEHFISWDKLAEQMGLDYADMRDVRKKVKATLRKIDTVLKLSEKPRLNVRFPSKGGGIVIRRCQPAVEPRKAQS